MYCKGHVKFTVLTKTLRDSVATGGCVKGFRDDALIGRIAVCGARDMSNLHGFYLKNIKSEVIRPRIDPVTNRFWIGRCIRAYTTVHVIKEVSQKPRELREARIFGIEANDLTGYINRGDNVDQRTSEP